MDGRCPALDARPVARGPTTSKKQHKKRNDKLLSAKRRKFRRINGLQLAQPWNSRELFHKCFKFQVARKA